MDEGWTAATRMLATHLLSIGGVVLASQRSLATYLAVTSLARPSFPAPSDTPAAPPPTSRVKAFIARPAVRKTLAVIAGITLVTAIYAVAIGAFVALFRFASQVVLDGILIGFFGAFVAFTFFSTIAIAVDIPTLVSYKPRFPKATEKDKQNQFTLIRAPAGDAPKAWFQRPRNAAIGAIVSSIALFGLTSMGFELVLVVVPVSWIVPVVSGFHAPQLSMRRVVQVLWGYIALLVTLSAIMIPIAMHFDNKDNAKTPEQLADEAKEAAEEAAKWSQPSDWVAHFMDMFQYLYVVGAPGVFVALTWRFDYISQHSAYLGSRPASNGQRDAALVPAMASLPTFQPRTATYAIGSLVCSVIGLTGTFIVNRNLGAMLSSTAGLVAVVPFMTLATALGAWRHGVLRDWWTYTETWVPTSGPAEQADEQALEAMSLETIDTKERA